MHTIIIFYRNYTVSERFALVTRRQVEESGFKINIHYVDLSSESLKDSMKRLRAKKIIPNIAYIWELEDPIEEVRSDVPMDDEKRAFLKKVYPDTLFLTFSETDRIERIGRNFEDNLAYDYILFDRIKADIEILDNPKTYSIANTETLKIEEHPHKNKYWLEDFLLNHPYCFLCEDINEARKTLKTIGEERLRASRKRLKEMEKKFKKKLDMEKEALKTLEDLVKGL